jgi:hypothetical protein
MSEASLVRHRELFGLERMVGQTIDVYETVLSPFAIPERPRGRGHDGAAREVLPGIEG